ncbi:hypothetical protein PI124_g20475 [Phytophthora idaei]|nr:hypothetical protein PI124_g20475 [Phytophthora idaei]
MVLVLGREKEGIPVEVLQLVDVRVEIPQFGLIRPPNVRVSGALMLWEYTQHQLMSGGLELSSRLCRILCDRANTPNGEVLTQSLQAAYGDSAEAVLTIIRQGRNLRAEGTSELHHQSSRSHAVLELDIVTSALAEARQEVALAQSRVVPLGKARDDLYIAIQSKMYVIVDGKATATGVQPRQEDQDRLKVLQRQVDAAETEVAARKARVGIEKAKCTGGMLVLVDLAGVEYTGEGLVRNSKEQKEAREINSSLLALKECIRVQARQGTGHIPYRNSKLTTLLECYLETNNLLSTIMITNVSSAATHLRKTLDSIRYAALVASAFKTTQHEKSSSQRKRTTKGERQWHRIPTMTCNYITKTF